MGIRRNDIQPRMLAPGYYSQECNAHKACPESKIKTCQCSSNALVTFIRRFTPTTTTKSHLCDVITFILYTARKILRN